MSANKEYVIIVAGGTGSRMNSDLPKQFLEIGGEAILLHTIRRFLAWNPSIHVILSVHADFMEYTRKLLLEAGLEKTEIRLVAGGPTRFDSVRNGLDLVTDEEAIVGIHDAARPLVSLTTISNCYSLAEAKGNAVPCITVNDSLRQVNADQSRAVDRSMFRIIQTPQCFRVSEIKKAFLRGYDPAFTDDATVLEAAGGTIYLTEGNSENIKITSPQDLLIAQTFLKS